MYLKRKRGLENLDPVISNYVANLQLQNDSKT